MELGHIKPPCILAIDAATGPCSVAVWRAGGIAAYLEDTQLPARQSARLLPMVEQALTQAGMGYGDLSTVACTVGPGSFTGIRVALAAARGIAFAAQLPALGFTTLEVLAWAARAHASQQRILALLNAGKGECYYQYFDSAGAALHEARVATAQAALEEAGNDPVMVAGNMRPSGQYSASPVTFPRADALASLAAARAEAALELKPFYIRPPDAKLPMKTG